MNNEEKAYIAGIIDGEGSIMLTKFHYNQSPAPCVTIASTSLELLEWIKERTNLGIIKTKKNYNPKKHQDSYTYIVKYNQAISLLTEIVDFLVIPQKKIRAKIIIEEYKLITPRNGRYSSKLIKAKEELYERFINT